MIDCPKHEGAYDCTPFCPLCEGEQEIEVSELTHCIECLERLTTDEETLETGRCEYCQRQYEKQNYDPMYEDLED